MPRTAALLALVTVAIPALPAAADERPNVVLIVADDLGYSDIGAFGSEIRTPNLDRIADAGLRLTSFHAAPTCGPTRAMLLSGVEHHRAGVGANAAALLRVPALRGRPGYEGYLNDRVVTVARLLADAGYFNAMTGKWDLGKQPGYLPTDRGFHRYFGIADGGASHFADATGNMRPVADAAYYEDGERVAQLDPDFYSSRDYTDRLLEFVAGRPGGDTPFFAYLAYTAPHWPLQVPDDWLDRYRGVYDDGWHAIRQARFERLQALELLPAGAALPPQNRAVDDWDGLSPARRAVELRRMELYAAMIELMDRHIGRFLDALDTLTERETVVIFLSDNGSEGNDIGRLLDNEYWVPATFDNRLANMGRQGSYVWLGAGWGQATVSPFRIYKSYTTEGGIRTPAIAWSTRGRFEPGVRDRVITVMDVAPTILELAGIEHPGTRYRNRDIHPLTGRSALAYLEGEAADVHGERPIGWELYGNRALIRGRYKAVLTWPPEGDGRWQLFDLVTDPAETRDLSADMPGLAEELARAWRDYADANGVAIIDEDIGYGRYP